MSQSKQQKKKLAPVHTSIQGTSTFTKGHGKARTGLRLCSSAGVRTLPTGLPVSTLDPLQFMLSIALTKIHFSKLPIWSCYSAPPHPILPPPFKTFHFFPLLLAGPTRPCRAGLCHTPSLGAPATLATLCAVCHRAFAYAVDWNTRFNPISSFISKGKRVWAARQLASTFATQKCFPGEGRVLPYRRKNSRLGEVKQRGNLLGMEERTSLQECHGQKTLKTKVHSRSYDQWRRCFQKVTGT